MPNWEYGALVQVRDFARARDVLTFALAARRVRRLVGAALGVSSGSTSSGGGSAAAVTCVVSPGRGGSGAGMS